MLTDKAPAVSSGSVDAGDEGGRTLKAMVKPWAPAAMRRGYRRVAGWWDAMTVGLHTSAELRRIARDPRPIVIGPWLSEIGFELLYWIPFLRWAQERFQIDPNRVTVISRGGNAGWYAGIASKYVDILDYFGAEEFRAGNVDRLERTRTQKHLGPDPFDDAILMRMKPVLGGEPFSLVHPSVMYALFMRFWSHPRRLGLVASHTSYRRHRVPENPPDAWGLPASYVAAKFYFSDCFPATPANRRLVRTIVETLAATSPVVLLETGLRVDDHDECGAGTVPGVYSASDWMTPTTNLAVQTTIVSHAKAFVGTYGGFSYLGPLYGVPSLAVFSAPTFFGPHLDVARHACRILQTPLTVWDAADATRDDATRMLKAVA
jgi:hypothetical protein